MIEKIKKVLKESKKVLLIIAGVVAALIAVVTSMQETVDVIPVKAEVSVDSIAVDSVSHE